MATRVINFYDDFTCLASNCPNTCCRGWRITIDPDTVNKYRSQKGLLGLRLRAMTSIGKDKEIARIMGRCVNETREGLCFLQRDGLIDLMPLICRMYPRRGILIGDELEVTFELSCPLTARLFLEHMDSIGLIPYDEDILPIWNQDMFDRSYYDKLLLIRERVVEYINSGVELYDITHNLYMYFRKLHNHIMQSDIDIVYITIDDVRDIKRSYAFYSFAIFDKIIMNDLNDNRLIREDPLHAFIRDYNKVFAKMTAIEADEYFDKTVRDMIIKHPKLADKYKAYLTYYLIQNIYSSYETVTFYKEYLLGLVYLMALITTDLIDYINGKDMEDVNRQIKHINACERRFRHNLGVKKSIYRRINEEFTKKKEGFIF